MIDSCAYMCYCSKYFERVCCVNKYHQLSLCVSMSVVCNVNTVHVYVLHRLHDVYKRLVYLHVDIGVRYVSLHM
jgi:hypothetical protein